MSMAMMMMKRIKMHLVGISFLIELWTPHGKRFPPQHGNRFKLLELFVCVCVSVALATRGATLCVCAKEQLQRNGRKQEQSYGDILIVLVAGRK